MLDAVLPPRPPDVRVLGDETQVQLVYQSALVVEAIRLVARRAAQVDVKGNGGEERYDLRIAFVHDSSSLRRPRTRGRMRSAIARATAWLSAGSILSGRQSTGPSAGSPSSA